MYKRFFAFGCSYTNYIWPTWADIIAEDLDIEYHNYGQAGFGNVAIQCEFLKADIEHKLNDDDLVIIMWSHWSREDRYISGGWQATGNVFNNDFYDSSFTKKYWDFDNDIIKNSTAMITINRAYGNLISFQSSIMAPGDFESIGPKAYRKTEDSNNLLNFYSPYLPNGVFDDTEAYVFDGHPSIRSYLAFVENKIYPHLGLVLKQPVREKYTSMDQSIKMIDNDQYIKHKRSAVSLFLKNMTSSNDDDIPAAEI